MSGLERYAEQDGGATLQYLDPLKTALDPEMSSVHGIFQARVLEWGAIAFSDVLLHIRTIRVPRRPSRQACSPPTMLQLLFLHRSSMQLFTTVPSSSAPAQACIYREGK